MESIELFNKEELVVDNYTQIRIYTYICFDVCLLYDKLIISDTHFFIRSLFIRIVMVRSPKS